jgi:hypothetical protein
MTASPEPTGDAELERLLDRLIGHSEATGGQRRLHQERGLWGRIVDTSNEDDARAALLAHIAAHYRRLDPDEIVMRHVNLGQRPPIRFEEAADDAIDR